MRPRPKKHRQERMNTVNEYLALVNVDEKCTLPEVMRRTGEGYVIDIEGSYEEKIRKAPLRLEIGCGKGAFISGLSKKFPNDRLLALELAPDVMLMAMEKCSNLNCENVRFYRCDATIVDTLLPENSVDVLYLNFSDPWPKARTAKRRLTATPFLEKYKKILKPEGRIYFKTDNRPLFDFSLEQFEEAGFELENVCFDLHNSPMMADNIETEYEKNFSAKGFTINYLEATFEK
ncbi:MAG: tRNA (guanosine(46)-N7)-methyltransferase TrmB [Ruminococcaceae bacterium]|nr:tRNA (guanosine(46)-N7)-methyltransferase TrmB [Oscillospiraceae bacterium]